VGEKVVRQEESVEEKEAGTGLTRCNVPIDRRWPDRAGDPRADRVGFPEVGGRHVADLAFPTTLSRD
jgi:hypothetical protein